MGNLWSTDGCKVYTFAKSMPWWRLKYFISDIDAWQKLLLTRGGLQEPHVFLTQSKLPHWHRLETLVLWILQTQLHMEKCSQVHSFITMFNLLPWSSTTVNNYLNKESTTQKLIFIKHHNNVKLFCLSRLQFVRLWWCWWEFRRLDDWCFTNRNCLRFWNFLSSLE